MPGTLPGANERNRTMTIDIIALQELPEIAGVPDSDGTGLQRCQETCNVTCLFTCARTGS